MSATRPLRLGSTVGWPTWVIAALVAYLLAYAARLAADSAGTVALAPATAAHIPPLAVAVTLLAWRAARWRGLDRRLRAAWATRSPRT